MDILLQIEIYMYNSLIAILATKFPQHIGDFMEYQKTTIKACKNFECTTCVAYNCCYRWQPAVMKSLKWVSIDLALYQKAFTGRVHLNLHCWFCLSDNHAGIDCPDRMQQHLNPLGGGWEESHDSRHIQPGPRGTVHKWSEFLLTISGTLGDMPAFQPGKVV